MSQHYRFAYIDLKRRLFERGEEVQSALKSEPDDYLSWIWHGCPQNPPPPVPGLTARVFSHQGQPAALITLPEPQDTPEAHFILVLFDDEEGPDVYTLEKTDPIFFEEGTVLGRLCPDHHENLGPGCPPDPETFIKFVLDERDGETP